MAATSPAPVVVQRARGLAVALLLTLLAFVQSPGGIAVDTKLDLTANPWGFLGKALHLWNPQASFGQIQDQAAGYLWPMGPFFGIGHSLGVPAWIVQRLWWALIMVVAFTGFRRVAERLGIGDPVTRVILGVGFAISPRIVGGLGAVSIEVLPLAMSPWVLLPLVSAAQGRTSPRRGAALSGVAVLCIGGVNAVATMAALPFAGLFLLVGVQGRRRLQLIGWWVVSVTLAILWWLIPLVLLGHYSPPFLDYIESSTTTTGVTSLSEALRGTSDWIGYLQTVRGPQWPAAWDLLTQPVVIAETFLVAGLGVFGLTRRDLPHRAWLGLGVLLGIALVTMGHVSDVDGLLAPQLRTALDGALAPLRNVHKFDAVLRLPLLLAACHAASLIRIKVELPRWRLDPQLGGRIVTSAMVVGLAIPLIATDVTPPGAYDAIPTWWHQTADFLARQHVPGRTLLIPGSSFADYTWGSTADEPLQPLASSDWAVRNSIPFAPPGNIRLLDEVDERLRHGDGSVGLTEALERSGVGLLVVRNDLDRVVTGTPRLALIHQALAESPDITRIATFGPVVGNAPTDAFIGDGGLDLLYPSVEVFRVGTGGTVADTYPAADALTVAGGPEALLDAADAGLVQGRATTLAGDPPVPGASGPELVTDTLRRTEAPFGTLPRDAATLTSADPFRVARAAHDYLPVTGAQRQTVAVTQGAASVTASSSGSDVDAVVLPGAQYTPAAAVDGSLDTSWHSGTYGSAVGQWLQLDLSAPQDLTQVGLALVDQAPLSEVTSVTVTTDRGSRTTSVAAGEDVQEVPVVAGSTSRVRITIAGVKGGGPGIAAGIRELQVPGVTVTQPLQTPAPEASAADFLLAVVPLATDGCVSVAPRPVCTPLLETPGVPTAGIDRIITVASPAFYATSVRARSRAGDALDALIDSGRPVQVTATSSATPDPASRPGAVLDGDVGTGWTAAADDKDPTLTLTWSKRHLVSGLQLTTEAHQPAAAPTEVTVVAGGITTTATPDSLGRISFPPVRTQRLEVHLVRAEVHTTSDTATFATSRLPVGLAELTVAGLEDLQSPIDRTARRDLPCGSGPDVTIDGSTTETSLTATVGDLIDRTPVDTTTCATSGVDLSAGQHHVTVTASDVTEPVTAEVHSFASPDVAPAQRTATPRVWDAEHRTLSLTSGAATVLAVHENTNPGWHATLDGQALTSVVVDGWQQGWVVPAGAAGTVTLDYTPAPLYRDGLVVGAVAVLGLLALVFVGGRGRGDDDETVPGGTPRWVLLAGLGLIVVSGGVVGLAATLVVAVASRLHRLVLPAVAVIGVAGAAAADLADRWPGSGAQSALSQGLVLAALGAVLAALTQASVAQRDGGGLDEPPGDG